MKPIVLIPLRRQDIDRNSFPLLLSRIVDSHRRTLLANFENPCKADRKYANTMRWGADV